MSAHETYVTQNDNSMLDRETHSRIRWATRALARFLAEFDDTIDGHLRAVFLQLLATSLSHLTSGIQEQKKSVIGPFLLTPSRPFSFDVQLH